MPVFATTATSIAYVDFEKEEEALKALEEMNGKEVGGQILSIDFFDRSQSIAMGNRQDVIGNENLRAIFIKNLDRKVRLKESLNTPVEAEASSY